MRLRHAAHCAQGIISRWKDEEYEQRLAAGIPHAALASAPTMAHASSSSSDDVGEEEAEDGVYDKADTALAQDLKGLSVAAAQQDTPEDQQDQLEDSSDVV